MRGIISINLQYTITYEVWSMLCTAFQESNRGATRLLPDISEKKKERMYDLSQASEGFFVAGLASHLQEEKL